MKIKDPKVRKRVLDLVKSLAEEEDGAAPTLFSLRDAFSARPRLAFARFQRGIDILGRDARRRPQHQQMIKHIGGFRRPDAALSPDTAASTVSTASSPNFLAHFSTPADSSLAV